MLNQKKAQAPGRLIEKINDRPKVDKKSIFFVKNSKFEVACPPFPGNQIN